MTTGNILRPAIPIKCLIRAVETQDGNYVLKEHSREIGSIDVSENSATAIVAMGGRRRKFVARDARACLDAIGWFQKGERGISETEDELEAVKEAGLSMIEKFIVDGKLSHLDDDLRKEAAGKYAEQRIRDLENKLSKIKREYANALRLVNGE